MNSTNILRICFVVAVICATLATVVQKDITSTRVKRQWGGWGQNQGSQFGNRNDFRSRNRQSNCVTSGINIVGLPISSYNCQDSAQSSRMSQRQGGFQNSGAMQGPLGGFLGGLMGR